MKLTLVLLACLLAAAFAPPATAQSSRGENESTRFFALPIVRETRELASSAEEHLRAGRYREAVRALQRILEDHASEVLQASSGTIGKSSTFPGAAEWALERLLELPARGREEYRTRYQARAAEALALALRAPDRSALMDIARRWPLTEAAVQAWWALGDLELEEGQPRAAELSWRRALQAAGHLELEAPSDARLARFTALTEARAQQPTSSFTLPRGDAEPWTSELDLDPLVPRRSPVVRHMLQPVSTGDTVLVSSTLRLYALDAFSGELRWKAGPPIGWSKLIARKLDKDLFEGIAHKELYLAPAFGNGIALAVLQQPFAENENDDWQGIEIMTSIPERRLHAFDLESGHELWNHSPRLHSEGKRLAWNGRGTYAQRMMISGSPTVAGARVIVPCYRMQGRIDYHVACYELASGKLLWSTQIVSGQRARNMFGRSMEEYCTSPVVVAGEHVLAQTELGTLACLDLFSGRILWETTYRQIPLQRTNSYRAPLRQVTWLTAPPVVVGDVVVATPSDSSEIVGLRLGDGARLWAYTEDSLQELDRRTELLGFDLLVGADEDHVYLSGAKLSALQKPGGLASTAPFIPRWTKQLERTDTAPRAVLAGDVIVAPNAVERVVFQRRTGERLALMSGSWGSRRVGGALCIGDGALFALSTHGILSGYYDWKSQMDRARRLVAAAPEEADLARAARLFLRRGRLQLDKGDAAQALETLREAGALLTRLRHEWKRPVSHSELDCTLAQAEALGRLQRPAEALEQLQQGLALATSRSDRAALLFQRESLLRARGGAPRLRTLEEIAACWGDEPLPAQRRDKAVRRWLAGTPGVGTRQPVTEPLPTRIWVALERASEHERARDLPAALEDLHAALALSSGILVAQGVPLASVVRARITLILSLPGGRAAYAGIEQRAGELYARARAEAGTGTLETLARRFPHSQAAEEALTLLVARASAARDARTVVRLVREALARGGLSARRETGLLLHLAHVLGLEGNLAFEHALVTRLAQRTPEWVSSIPSHGGKSLGVLAAALKPEDLEPEAAPVVFDSGVVSTSRPLLGSPTFLGVILPPGVKAEDYPLELHVYGTNEELRAYSNATSNADSSAALDEPRWRHPLKERLLATAFPRGRMIYATREEIRCLDEDGNELWSHALGSRRLRSLAEKSGTLVALMRDGLVLALDSRGGLLLWERNLSAGRNWSGPLLGETHAIFFSRVVKLDPQALCLDLFRGSVTAEFGLEGFDSKSPLEEASWVSGNLLITPAYLKRPAQLRAWELDGGRSAWATRFGPDEDLRAVVQSDGRTFPITLTVAGNGGIYELDERLGSLRLVLPLKPGERIMGLEPQTVTALRAPYLFTYSYGEGKRSVPIRAVHLPFGVQWTWSLPVASKEIYGSRSLPMPAVSDEHVAIAYLTRPTSGRGGTQATIVFVDKRAGVKVDTRLLHNSAFGQTSRLELRGLGEALFVLGKGDPPRGSCLDILRPLR